MTVFTIPPCMCGCRRSAHFLQEVMGGAAHPCGQCGPEACPTYRAAALRQEAS